MEEKSRHIIKDLIYEISQKVNIFSEYGIMNTFNGVDIYHNRLYVKNIVEIISNFSYKDMAGMIQEK